jgi:hypothetical protein
MAKASEERRGEYRRIEKGLGHGSTEEADTSMMSVSPPARRLDVGVGTVIHARLPRSFWPWSTQVGLSADGVVELIEARLNDSQGLELELRATGVGEVLVEVHDYVDRDRFKGGPMPRIPNRSLSISVVVA